MVNVNQHGGEDINAILPQISNGKQMLKLKLPYPFFLLHVSIKHIYIVYWGHNSTFIVQFSI